MCTDNSIHITFPLFDQYNYQCNMSKSEFVWWDDVAEMTMYGIMWFSFLICYLLARVQY